MSRVRHRRYVVCWYADAEQCPAFWSGNFRWRTSALICCKLFNTVKAARAVSKKGRAGVSSVWEVAVYNLNSGWPNERRKLIRKIKND